VGGNGGKNTTYFIIIKSRSRSTKLVLSCLGGRDSSVGIAACDRLDVSVFADFLLLAPVQTGSGIPHSPLQRLPWSSPRGKTAGAWFWRHSPLNPRIRMSGAVPLHPLCAFYCMLKEELHHNTDSATPYNSLHN
jgi:hypothetical protein